MKKTYSTITLRRHLLPTLTLAAAFLVPMPGIAGNDDPTVTTLPTPVAAAVAAASPDFVLGEGVFREDKGYYKLEGRDADGNKVELLISPNGTLIKHEVNGVHVGGDDDDDTVDLPAAVQATLDATAPGLAVRESWFDAVNNVYKIEGTNADGNNVELLISPDGTLTKHEVNGVHVGGEDDTVDLPAAVQATLDASAPGLAVRESRFDAVNNVYKIEGTNADGNNVELLISPDGTLTKHEVNGVHVGGEDDTVDLPAAVQATLDATAPGLAVRESRFDAVNNVYKIEGTNADGNNVELLISPDGTLTKHEVNGVHVGGEDDTVDLPAAVQATLDATAPGLAVRESWFDAVNNVYKIEGTNADGNNVELLISPDGTLTKHEVNGVHVGGEDDTVDLPAAVQATLDATAPGLAVRESRFDAVNNVYKIEGTNADGNNVELLISPDGTLTKHEVNGVHVGGEDDTVDLPAAVQATLDATAPGLAVRESWFDAVNNVYKIEGTNADGNNVELLISPDGTLTKHEVNGVHVGGEDDTVDLPAAVQATIDQYAVGMVIEESKLKQKLGVSYYKVEGTLDGQEIELKIALDGTLLELEKENVGSDDDRGQGHDDQISPDALPAAVMAALAEVAPGLVIGKVESLGLVAGQHFEIKGTLGGKPVEIKINADGTVRKIEIDSDRDGLGDADEHDSGSDPDDSDSDDDAFPDGFERRHGCNHRDNSSRPDIATPTVSDDGIVISVDTAEGLKFQLERSDDGSSWSPFGKSFIGSGASVRVALPSEDSSGYVRVRVIVE